MHKKVNLRKAKRYPMSAAVAFCWDSGGGVSKEGQGTTLDISSCGVFVVTDVVPRAGDRLELEIDLRPNGRESRLVRFNGEGKVVRTITNGSDSGFAAEVLFQTEGVDRPAFECGGAGKDK